MLNPVLRKQQQLDQINSLPSQQRILIVDDSQELLELQQSILEVIGYKVSTAESAAEAFDFLSKNLAPDLILLDMQLPDMTGTVFIESLEAKYPEIIKSTPIVFVSGVNGIPDSKAVGFIHKPFVIDAYLESIRKYIEIGMSNSPYTH